MVLHYRYLNVFDYSLLLLVSFLVIILVLILSVAIIVSKQCSAETAIFIYTVEWKVNGKGSLS